jgi:hypothetical protein
MNGGGQRVVPSAVLDVLSLRDWYSYPRQYISRQYIYYMDFYCIFILSA